MLVKTYSSSTGGTRTLLKWPKTGMLLLKASNVSATARLDIDVIRSLLQSRVAEAMRVIYGRTTDKPVVNLHISGCVFIETSIELPKSKSMSGWAIMELQ